MREKPFRLIYSFERYGAEHIKDFATAVEARKAVTPTMIDWVIVQLDRGHFHAIDAISRKETIRAYRRLGRRKRLAAKKAARKKKQSAGLGFLGF